MSLQAEEAPPATFNDLCGGTKAAPPFTSSSTIILKDKTNADAVKPYAYSVCREYLGGVWKQAHFDEFQIKKMSGGLSNYLFKCELDDTRFKSIGNEPTRILLRLYGENSKKPATLIKDLLIFAIMSDNVLGPKLYGVFSEGRLEELIQADCLEQNAMYVPEISSEIASIMARFHVLDMPFIKEPSWLWNQTKHFIAGTHDLKFKRDQDRERYAQLQQMQLEREFYDLRRVLEATNSPVVFCHNDVNVGNILKLENKLMYIDYEYGSYNYRGFDFGNHFCEWMYNNNYDAPPYFQYNYELYPNREQQLNFVRAYVSSACKCLENKSTATGTDTNNNDYLDEERILVEANRFALASHLFWTFWAIGQTALSHANFEFLEYALARTDAYFKQKKILFPDGFNLECSGTVQE